VTSDLIQSVLARLHDGGIVGIVDDGRDRPDVDLAAAGASLAPANLRRLRELGDGRVLVAVEPDRLDQLAIELVDSGRNGPASGRTSFAQSVALRHGREDPSSDASVVETIRALADPDREAADFRSPGHVIPLRARQGGVLRRIGHTEAATDLSRLAKLPAVAALTRLVDRSGAAVGPEAAARLLDGHDVPLVRISQIIHHRRSTEQVVFRSAEAELPTEHGAFRAIAFHDTTTGEDHLALVKGDLSGETAPLVRVHSECLTGDAFGSLRCDCGAQLAAAMRRVDAEGRGVILYMRQEGRGIGLANKLRAYQLQERGLDTVEANQHLGFAVDLRDYGVGAQILRALGLRDIRLLTNNPKKTEGFRTYGLNVVEQIPLTIEPGEHNRRYLETKRERLGHVL
jgi:3,4-dihydroxy 2-butanone 4-phosphate synthase/GTP cyclohydrolase II